MTGAQALRIAGEALYGPRFATELANQLGMSDRNIRRLLAGSHEPAPSLLQEIWQLIEDRKSYLDEAQSALAKTLSLSQSQ